MIGFSILFIMMSFLRHISSKRLELLNFVSIIQLVTALNFANISSSLHEKMFKVLIDVKSFFNFRFGNIQNKMTADLESLKSMSPIETKDGNSNESTINDLTKEYFNLAAQWEAEKNRIESKMGEFFNTKGINSLFLFISLYCVVDMFFIAYEAYKTNDISYQYWFGGYTMFSTLISIMYFCLIMFDKTKNISKGTLYVIVTGLTSVLLILSYFSYALNSFIAGRFSLMEKDVFLCLTDTLAVVLPFLGFVLCLIFIICIWLQITEMTSTSIMNLREQHIRLHKRKLVLDQTYESFKPSEQMQFGYDKC